MPALPTFYGVCHMAKQILYNATYFIRETFQKVNLSWTIDAVMMPRKYVTAADSQAPTKPITG